jgi:hypothetical protein
MKMRTFLLPRRLSRRWLKENLPQALSVKMLKRRQNAIGMAMIFLGLIIVPSGLLGYFSWRALENESCFRASACRKLSPVCPSRRREIDGELENVEKRSVAAVKEVHRKNNPGPSVKDLDRLVEGEPLLAASFLLAAPGKVVYPRILFG